MTASNYPFRQVEKRWQSCWQKNKSFKAELNSDKPKKYVLEMLPYPSGRLHMGHVRNYAIGDAMARYYRLAGYNVFHPMGWDAFGMPAENAARERDANPAQWTLNNIKQMRRDLDMLGFSYDWDSEVTTCLPDYYGQEQKLFLEFLRKGLAYRSESWVNWDPVDNSVLANEQVVNGRGWRSGALVEKRKLNQWSLKITDYNEELLRDIEQLKGWPEKVRLMQTNWIGKSQGANVRFYTTCSKQEITVFTTRPDTLFGASFIGISAGHPIAEQLAKSNTEVKAFINRVSKSSTDEQTISTMDKEGIDTGLRVRHPFDESLELPVYIANFVLMEYGTGAVFACPAHDERDHEFAVKYGLPIRPVVQTGINEEHDFTSAAYTGDGEIFNSQFLDGMTSESAKKAAIAKLEQLGLGQSNTTYRLRDWCVSRQRYWGCPIPVIHCESCGVVPVPEKDLPVVLPEDVDWSVNGNPLEHHPTWKKVDCPKCGKKAERETDTFDTFFESSWYFLRYCCPDYKDPIDSETVNYWSPADLYIGGIEHAVMHLLYARFFTKVVRDLGHVNFGEPFKQLLTQGMVCHQTYKTEQGEWLYPSQVKRVGDKYVTIEGDQPVIVGRSEKMSKSKKNLIDPQQIFDAYGADAARLFVLSDTPADRDFDWSEDGVEGSWRYLNRLWRLAATVNDYKSEEVSGFTDTDVDFRKLTHGIFKKLTQAYEDLAFNKAIALARELTNELEGCIRSSEVSRAAVLEAYERVIIGLSPVVPHVCSEILEQLGHKDVINLNWPKIDEQLASVEEVNIAVQVNGKLRGDFTAVVGQDKADLQSKALALPVVQKYLEGKEPRKVIVVPDRIVNVVC